MPTIVFYVFMKKNAYYKTNCKKVTKLYLHFGNFWVALDVQGCRTGVSNRIRPLERRLPWLRLKFHHYVVIVKVNTPLTSARDLDLSLVINLYWTVYNNEVVLKEFISVIASTNPDSKLNDNC